MLTSGRYNWQAKLTSDCDSNYFLSKLIIIKKNFWNPMSGQYLAFSQGIQAFWEYLFSWDWYVPTGHGFGFVELSGQKCPTGQLSQILLLIYFPKPHVCKNELPTGQYLSAGHFLQTVFPFSSWKYPFGHFSHVIVPLFVEKVPVVHFFQSADVF